MKFKFQVIGLLPAEQWELAREDVLGWYRAYTAVRMTPESGGE